MSALPRITGATAAAMLLGACASTGQGADPATLAGCHYFQQDEVSRHLQLPWGVRLLDEPLDGWPALQQYDGVRVATTLNARDEADHPFGYWRPLDGDSILIGYPAGGGLSLRLGGTAEGLVGTARGVGDATLDTERATHGVRLMRARCPEDL